MKELEQIAVIASWRMVNGGVSTIKQAVFGTMDIIRVIVTEKPTNLWKAAIRKGDAMKIDGLERKRRKMRRRFKFLGHPGFLRDVIAILFAKRKYA